MASTVQAGSQRLTFDEGIVVPDTGEPADEVFADGFLIPGLRDAHFHPVTYAASLVVPSLKTARDFSDVAARLQEAATPLPRPLWS